ncbi:sugar ABC transporter ATP-binding protein [Microbaculum marinum]|uniref:Sugar ABC transporter ATP-binding protein n=1 Tax=Microbaculum marinum TaxID=1764581 RepID=A0AAW9S1R4_9HYPH
MTPVLELRNGTKEYRGVPAVKDVTFTLERGEVHALLGENGAGKSTLTKMLAGVVEPTAGEIYVDGRQTELRTPSEALRRGIAMVYQETSLVPSLTVAQNLYLTDDKHFHRLRGIYIAGQQFLQSLNFHVDPTALVSSLGAGQKQMVEIARAVHHNAQVIIFDEPTSTLTPEEKYQFFSLVDRLRKRGVSIIFISHALEEALQISDRITVMRDGEHVITDLTSAFDRDKIIRAMVGRALSDELYGARKDRRVRPAGDKVLSVQNLSMQNIVRNTSFSVFSGQITGVFGLIGSGRTEAAKVVAGVLKRDFFHGGQVRLDGRPVRYRVPRPAVRDGIIYVTEDRKIEGFFETMSIAENIYLGALAGGRTKAWTVSMGEMKAIADEWTRALNVRAINSDARVIELSGGNQQKVVVAKALVQKPRLIIFDEPTRGVDVGAIAEIHHLIERLADEGIAVMVISSYLPEILQLSDRILVCRQGRIVEEFAGHKADEETIMYAAVH